MATAKQTTAKETAEKSKEQLEEAYELAEKAAFEAVNAIKQETQQKWGESSHQAEQVVHSAGDVIKQRPLLSIGCAFLAGWAVSKLIK